MAGQGNRLTSIRWQRPVLVLFGLGGLVVLAVLWNKAPTFYENARDQGGAVATTRAGILAVVAGFVAFTGVLLTLAETRRATSLTLAETRRATDLTHIRELFNAAVGQLGSNTLDVRLGGIYALAHLAKDSGPDQHTVMEVLSAFVREHTTPGLPGYLRRMTDQPPALAGRDTESASRPDTDVQAALTVLGRLPPLDRVPLDQVPPVNLIRVHISNAFLPNANFTDAWLGAANLTGANLQGANLTGANLHGTNLTGVDLFGAILIDARPNEANLSDAQNLTQEQLDSTGVGNAKTVLPRGVSRPTHWSA